MALPFGSLGPQPDPAPLVEGVMCVLPSVLSQFAVLLPAGTPSKEVIERFKQAFTERAGFGFFPGTPSDLFDDMLIKLLEQELGSRSQLLDDDIYLKLLESWSYTPFLIYLSQHSPSSGKISIHEFFGPHRNNLIANGYIVCNKTDSSYGITRKGIEFLQSFDLINNSSKPTENGQRIYNLMVSSFN